MEKIDQYLLVSLYGYEYQRLPNKDIPSNRNYDSSYRNEINPITCKNGKIDQRLYDGKCHLSVGNAKKMLSSRNSSNHYYPIEKQKKISSYTKPRTVQHGIPTGTCPNGSTAMANILVHRHQPISQVTTSENVNSHRFSSTLTTTGANYSLGRHQLSSTPRLCFDLYPQKKYLGN
ncbi:unnamed protein product [Heterobilharzia americana]|nr:unnamed protein product [Heterobilharzia americana]